MPEKGDSFSLKNAPTNITWQEVIGGWLVIATDNSQKCIALAFVPKPK
jgi:hypothetical protein